MSLQCDLAKHLSSLSAPKAQDGIKKTVKAVISGPANHVISNSKAATQTSCTSSGNSIENGVPKTANVNSTSSINTSTVKTVTTTKPVKLASTSSTNSVTSFSRVVTTHTVTSGGKTMTKPITILYASPSKNLAQNGIGPNNTAKHLHNNCVNKVSATNDSKPIAKLEVNAKTSTVQCVKNTNLKPTVAQNANIKSPTAQISKANSIQSPKNTISQASRLKARVVSESNGIKPRTIGESTKAVSVSPPGTNIPRSVSMVGTVSGATKVIVLTNTSNGNIIKTITTTSASTQRTVGGSVTHATSGSSSTVTTPSVQRIVVQSSPQKGMVNGSGPNVGSCGSSPTTQAASPVSTICAVSGLDNIQG